MNIRLASLLTLGMLGTMVFAILATVALFFGFLDFVTLLGLTILVNAASWLLAPYANDLLYRLLYKMRFCGEEEFRASAPELAEFIARVCAENKIKFPKIGIIEDDNPTAFTYGSYPSNARLVFSQGIFVYLEADEAEAVVAHELGHIVHWDFAVMTLANTLVQMLYEIYAVLAKSNRKRRNDKNSGLLAYVGLISYVFYVIATYVLLLLSRSREYYADEFSAKTTGRPNDLSSALIKIAYGMVTLESDTRSKRLLESTRAIGIMDPRSAKGVGMISRLPGEVGSVLAFDFVSPWAGIMELNSTHPLTGKRIKRLDDLAVLAGREKSYDIPGIINGMSIDKKRLYSGFCLGVFVYVLPAIAIASGFLLAMLYGSFRFLFFFWGGALIFQALYKFSSGRVRSASLKDLMSDIYASPVRGEKVALRGKIIGRGEAGAYVSEDLMFQDPTGIIYLDYSSKLGRLGNLFFALKKVMGLVGQEAEAEGWFFRGNYQLVSLSRIRTASETVKSHPAFWPILGGLAVASLGLLV